MPFTFYPLIKVMALLPALYPSEDLHTALVLLLSHLSQRIVILLLAYSLFTIILQSVHFLQTHRVLVGFELSSSSFALAFGSEPRRAGVSFSFGLKLGAGARVDLTVMHAKLRARPMPRSRPVTRRVYHVHSAPPPHPSIPLPLQEPPSVRLEPLAAIPKHLEHSLPPLEPLKPSSLAGVQQDQSESLESGHQELEADHHCLYCGLSECWIRKCRIAMLDQAARVCKRTADGTITLPDGSAIPRSPPGASMRVQLYMWHSRHSLLCASTLATEIGEVPDEYSVGMFNLPG